MRSVRISLFAGGALAVALIHSFANTSKPVPEPAAVAVEKGAKWLASVQGQDGGWGQDGGETTYVRQGQRLETTGNDVANTAVAGLALLRAGDQYRPNVERAAEFILSSIDRAPAEGLAVTSLQGTQIQRKLGPYIDTFLASMFLAEVEGRFPKLNTRVRSGMEKCVAKIEKNQLKDGSWNLAGGWAPVLGTSLASRSLDAARAKGFRVDHKVMAKIDDYAKKQAAAPVVAGGGSGRVASTAETVSVAAGVSLYQSAQVLEQLSRTNTDREANAQAIKAVTGQLSDRRFVDGFGSMGGEEFFSYLNISDSLRRTGGADWAKWNRDMKTRLVALQNNDGTWAGHHCITGRVAVTGAAMLTLLVERDAARR